MLTYSLDILRCGHTLGSPFGSFVNRMTDCMTDHWADILAEACCCCCSRRFHADTDPFRIGFGPDSQTDSDFHAYVLMKDFSQTHTSSQIFSIDTHCCMLYEF
jgi:hypothetical protein